MNRDLFLQITLDEYGTLDVPIMIDSNRIELLENEYVTGKIDIVSEDNSFFAKTEITCIRHPYDYFRSFSNQKACIISFPFSESFQGLAIQKYNPFWTKPVFINKQDTGIVSHVQHLLFKTNDKYVHVMPLCENGTISELIIDGTSKQIKIVTKVDNIGVEHINTVMMVASQDENPYQVINKSFQFAVDNHLIKTPLRNKKEYPKQLEGLGWCSWNAFYHGVSETGIEEKLQEFQEKKILVSWIIIDDGWFQAKDFKLLSFKEDKNKFPSGLKSFIERIKTKYGVKYVGVWHSFTGYWFGIEKNSEVYLEEKDCLLETASGLIVPSGSYEKTYSFYSHWHYYLKNQGVDFLKVDTQGNAKEFLKGFSNSSELVSEMHRALEQSIKDHFNNAMINCMGMDTLDMYNRQYSAVVRSSDDFFPEKENGFVNHIEQNVYNSLFQNQLYYCDFDMWWSKHISAKQSSILRAISGGPVYLSDKVGESDLQYLKEIMAPDGTIKRMDAAARPTEDCLFGYQKVLKVFNEYKGKKVVAYFNLSDETVFADLEDGLGKIELQPGDVEVLW